MKGVGLKVCAPPPNPAIFGSENVVPHDFFVLPPPWKNPSYGPDLTVVFLTFDLFLHLSFLAHH